MVVGNQVSALLADRFKPGRFTCYLQFLAAAADTNMYEAFL